MKITKRQLRRIIKEERAKLNEDALTQLTQNDWFNLSDEVDAIVDKYVSFGYSKESVVAALSQYVEG